MRQTSVKKRVGDEALGRNRDGLTTKLPAVIGERGRPHALLTAVPAPRYVLADKGYDANAVVEQVEQLGPKW